MQTPESTHTLSADQELRIQLNKYETSIAVKLRSGTAELFGSPLVIDRSYTLTGVMRIAIFTWHGCVLHITGTPSVCYTGSETPMVSYINTHAALETQRQRAADAIKQSGVKPPQGPRCLIVGSSDSGKSTLARILVNYACRSSSSNYGHHQPLLVDLDPGSNMLSVPGSITTAAVEHMLDVELGDKALPAHQLTPISCYYGNTQLTASAAEIYCKQVSKIAALVDARCQQHDNNRIAGVIIKLPGDAVEQYIANGCSSSSNSSNSQNLIMHTAIAFSVDVIIVVGHEQLYSELQRDPRLLACNSSNNTATTAATAVGNHNIAVVKVGRSGGVATRVAAALSTATTAAGNSVDVTSRRAQRDLRFAHYFYGSSSSSSSLSRGLLSPCSLEVSFSDLLIYRLDGATAAPTTALPLHTKSKIDKSKLVRLFPNRELINSVMAVAYIDTTTTAAIAQIRAQSSKSNNDKSTAVAKLLEPQLADAVACGYVYCSEVNMKQLTVTLLLPSPGELPSNTLLFGAVKWFGET